MRKLFLFAILAIATSSCSTLKNTATTHDFNMNAPYTVPVIADLEISENRILHAYIPPKNVRRGGTQNTINTAVREALATNGNADVLVGLETQVRFNAMKKIKSVVVTGYPAKYKNFRQLDEEVWYSTPYFHVQHDNCNASKRR